MGQDWRRGRAFDGRRVYALIEAENGGLYRSDDGGDTWSLADSGHCLRQPAWYYSTLTVDPRNPDVVWCPQVPMLKSIDGGRTFKQVKDLHHGDNHDVWIDPRNPSGMIASNDGGVDISFNGGETWFARRCRSRSSITSRGQQHALSRQRLHAGHWHRQSGPSNSLSGGGITNCDWHEVGGGEAGYTASEPKQADIVYGGEYGGIITRYDQRTARPAMSASIPSIPRATVPRLALPFSVDGPDCDFAARTAYSLPRGNVLFKSTDGGLHWTAISPDLTRNDKSKQKWSGGPITGDNTGAETYDTIFAMAESPRQRDLLWAGTDDGLVHVSRDGGKNWMNVTSNISGMPEWGTVDLIEASPYDAGTAYVVVDAHRLDDMRPYLFKTSDFGQTWKNLSARLPQDVYLHAVRQDPVRKGMLYVGTEHGVAYSTDDGVTWQELKLNLPTVAVHDLHVKNDDLVIGTHGRSIWILDDLTFPTRHVAGDCPGRCSLICGAARHSLGPSLLFS